MPVSPADVRRVAELARLRLTDTELERMAAELNGILEHVEALPAAPDGEEARQDEAGEADVREADAAPAGGSGSADPATPLRPDEPGPDPLSRPPASLAPDWADGFFTVPRLASHDGDADARSGPAPDPGEERSR